MSEFPNASDIDFKLDWVPSEIQQPRGFAIRNVYENEKKRPIAVAFMMVLVEAKGSQGFYRCSHSFGSSLYSVVKVKFGRIIERFDKEPLRA